MARNEKNAVGDTRGREADRPGEVPARGWREVLGRVKEEVGRDNVSIVAAGVAFYVMLSLFPALVAAVAIYGIVADPAQVQSVIGQLEGVLPPAALDLVESQLQGIVTSAPTTLGWGAALSILLALWSAAKGAKSLIAGVNLVYDEEEHRGFVRLQGLALLFTLGLIVAGLLAVALITVVPNVTDMLGAAGAVAAMVAQWVLLLVLILAGLAAIYRFAPDRDDPRWRWVTPGSVTAGVLWLVASALFSWYAANFGSFNETYGALAGVVVLLLWLQITFFLVLLGGELNSELEHQTRHDTTRGPSRPMGRRGAVKADSAPEE